VLGTNTEVRFEFPECIPSLPSGMLRFRISNVELSLARCVFEKCGDLSPAMHKTERVPIVSHKPSRVYDVATEGPQSGMCNGFQRRRGR